MKNLLALALSLCILTSAGCSGTKYNLASLAGLNVRDLEAAKDTGISKTFKMSHSEAFKNTVEILKTEKLTIFLSSEKRGYIVAMGFKEQVDTTRVGIFFDPVSETETKVTLSCLSSLALPKAEKIIFTGLSKIET